MELLRSLPKPTLPIFLFLLLSRQPALGHPESKSSTKSNMLRGRPSATSADEQPHIGTYRLLKTIGKGNFAKVKLARHVLTGKEVREPQGMGRDGGAFWQAGAFLCVQLKSGGVREKLIAQ